MSEETLTKLSEVFHHSFHRQTWDHYCELPSEINRIAWKNCTNDVIQAYLKLDKEQNLR